MSAPEDSPRTGAFRRSLRRFTLGSGPLKRPSDRVQVVGRVTVVVSLLISPPLAVATTTSTTTQLERVAAAEAAERFPAQALLLEHATSDEDRYANGEYGAWMSRRVQVRAEWPLRAGGSRQGTVAVLPGTPAGASIDVWVDRDGDLAAAPSDPAEIPGTAAAAGVSVLVGVPLAAGALYAALSHGLGALRHRRWAWEWAMVEPDWSSRTS